MTDGKEVQALQIDQQIMVGGRAVSKKAKKAESSGGPKNSSIPQGKLEGQMRGVREDAEGIRVRAGSPQEGWVERRKSGGPKSTRMKVQNK